MSKGIELEVKGKQETMSIEEFTRWACLLEAVEISSNKCEELGIDPDKDDCWVKPIAFQHYLDERYLSMLHDLTVEHAAGRL